jgi:hypothetical protein
LRLEGHLGVGLSTSTVLSHLTKLGEVDQQAHDILIALERLLGEQATRPYR